MAPSSRSSFLSFAAAVAAAVLLVAAVAPLRAAQASAFPEALDAADASFSDEALNHLSESLTKCKRGKREGERERDRDSSVFSFVVLLLPPLFSLTPLLPFFKKYILKQSSLTPRTSPLAPSTPSGSPTTSTRQSTKKRSSSAPPRATRSRRCWPPTRSPARRCCPGRQPRPRPRCRGPPRAALAGGDAPRLLLLLPLSSTTMLSRPSRLWQQPARTRRSSPRF